MPVMDLFRIRNFEIRNRLFVGTGKYAATRTLTVLPAPGAPPWFALTGLAG